MKNINTYLTTQYPHISQDTIRAMVEYVRSRSQVICRNHGLLTQARDYEFFYHRGIVIAYIKYRRVVQFSGNITAFKGDCALRFIFDSENLSQSHRWPLGTPLNTDRIYEAMKLFLAKIDSEASGRRTVLSALQGSAVETFMRNNGFSVVKVVREDHPKNKHIYFRDV